MAKLKYTKDHQWIFMNGDTGNVGITEYAQGQLGDVVFVELPEVGKKFNQNDEVAVVESNKAASEVYSPVDGMVASVNNRLENNPTVINQDAEGGGWLFELRPDNISDLAELMSESEYMIFIQQFVE